MRIVYFEVGKEAKVMEVENTLESLQKLVRGYIETVTLGDIIVVCNEEGRILGLPFNRYVGSIDFVGNIFMVTSDGEDFASLSDEQIDFIEQHIIHENIIR